MKYFNLILVLLMLPISSYGEKLSESELYYRCYAHLTSQRVKRNDELLIKIKKGVLSGADACINILNKGVLTDNGTLKYPTDDDSKNVLSTMTKVHATFFEKRALIGAGFSYTVVENDIYDEESSALFYSRALFGINSKISNIFSGKKDLEGIRTEGSPLVKGYSSDTKKSDFTYKVTKTKKSPLPVNFVEVGGLVGVKTARSIEVPVILGGSISGKDILSSMGGGLLGAKSYLKKILPTGNISNSDGAGSMNRTWSQSVLKDFLCKTLPAVRLSDGSAYVRKNADAVFRKSLGCIRCHTTMDQLAAGARGLKVGAITNGNATKTNPQIRYPYHLKVTQKNSAVWPLKRDSKYSLRPPNGVLYFRSYNGDLVRSSFSNFSELGDKILEIDDFYACVAKKYYHHFTGITVSLADINDPFSTVQLNKQDLFHREQVIKLGKNLKSSQSTHQLIKDIFNSKVYQSQGFTLLDGE